MDDIINSLRDGDVFRSRRRRAKTKKEKSTSPELESIEETSAALFESFQKKVGLVRE